MQVFAAQNLAVLLVALLAVALPSASGQLLYNASFAIDAGSPACPNITACTGYASVVACGAPSYMGLQGGNPPFNFAASNYTQLAAVPFRVRDGYTFEVSGLAFHMGLGTVAPNVSVYFYAANTTNSSLPGVPLPGWANGKIYQSTIQYLLKTLPSPGVPYYRVGVSMPPFNLTQGLYYVSIVTWGTPTSSLFGQNYIDGYLQPGAYWSTFHGYSLNGQKGQFPPNQLAYANWRWDVVPLTSNVVLCLWPTGRVFNQLGSVVTAPTPVPSPTPPPNVWVRYPLATDLNQLVPSEFAVSVSDYFQLAPDAQVQVIRAVRAEVVPVADPPVAESPQPSPTAGTVVDFAIVANGTASYDLMARAANVTSLHELRVWNVSIAASPTLVPVYNITL